LPEFEVASIKLNKSGSGSSHSDFDHGRFSATNEGIRGLIEYDAFAIAGPQIEGGPGWLRFRRFDIEAKADDATAALMEKLGPEDRGKLKRQLIAQLLAERFKLTIHWETKELPVYGDGSNMRDWLFVEDHAEALLEIVRAGRAGESYNIGGGSERRNLEVVEAICDLVDELAPGRRGEARRDLISYVQDRPGHDLRYAVDDTKLRRNFGWRPAETFESGIRKTVKWYLDHEQWVRDVTSGGYRQWIETHYSS